MALAGADEIWLGGERLKGRAQMVQNYLDSGRSDQYAYATPDEVGCHGMPALLMELPYVDLSTLFVVPVAHAVLYGLVKDFLNIIFGPLPKGNLFYK